MLKVIIFDMDGVLVDSEKAIARASKEALAEWNICANLEDFKPYTGMGDDKFIGGVAEQYGICYESAMKARAYEIYMQTASERVEVFSWSKPLLLELKEKGFQLAVASASDVVKVECNIGCIGIDTSIFTAIVTGSDVTNKKPNPEIFLKASEKCNVAPCECLVIEDALSGAKAAKAAGMQCITVTTSFEKDLLKQAGADFVVDDLREVPTLLASLRQ